MTAETLGTITLPGMERSVPVARHCVGAVLAAAGCASVDDVLLVVTELVGNAIKHTASGVPGGTLTLRVSDAGQKLIHIEVIDSGSETIPEPREPDPESFGGRGLWLVGRCSKQWGVRELGGGHRAVWALMPATDGQPGALDV
ncbi:MULTISPECIES: ATP-binding protein [unclassified Streptosporangium]|uniref:ATP-binding protein n=1 Tax=unclassified Streptosporangium TaxID=2632669 RepID=UPI002E2B2DF5|nr:MULTISPECIES: ATP-binding protein [unclassified Streptosporangium]